MEVKLGKKRMDQSDFGFGTISRDVTKKVENAKSNTVQAGTKHKAIIIFYFVCCNRRALKK